MPAKKDQKSKKTGRIFPSCKRKTGPKPKKSPAGRPTLMTDKTIAKLREAFMIGCTDQEACLFAEISVDTLYKYQRENPNFINEKKQLKQFPFLKARKTIVNNLIDPKYATWYMEKKKGDEFVSKSQIDQRVDADVKSTIKSDNTIKVEFVNFGKNN